MTKLELEQRNAALVAALMRITELALAQRQAIRNARLHLAPGHPAWRALSLDVVGVVVPPQEN